MHKHLTKFSPYIALKVRHMSSLSLLIKSYLSENRTFFKQTKKNRPENEMEEEISDTINLVKHG